MFLSEREKSRLAPRTLEHPAAVHLFCGRQLDVKR